MSLSEEVAVEVMGWEKRTFNEWVCVDGDNSYYFGELWVPKDAPEMTAEELWESDYESYNAHEGKYSAPVSLWKPDSDIRQARMIWLRGCELTATQIVAKNLYDSLMVVFPKNVPEWFIVAQAVTATAEQICQAVLMAVREARK